MEIPMRALFASISVAVMAISASAAHAGDLNLLCKTELTRANGTQGDFLRQYEVTFSSHRVVVYDIEAGKVQQQFSTQYSKADDRIIVIAQTLQVYHEINRMTGMAFSRNINGELRRGICSPSSPMTTN
jgi:hypothetical protein